MLAGRRMQLMVLDGNAVAAAGIAVDGIAVTAALAGTAVEQAVAAGTAAAVAAVEWAATGYSPDVPE